MLIQETLDAAFWSFLKFFSLSFHSRNPGICWQILIQCCNIFFHLLNPSPDTHFFLATSHLFFYLTPTMTPDVQYRTLKICTSKSPRTLKRSALPSDVSRAGVHLQPQPFLLLHFRPCENASKCPHFGTEKDSHN